MLYRVEDGVTLCRVQLMNLLNHCCLLGHLFANHFCVFFLHGYLFMKEGNLFFVIAYGLLHCFDRFVGMRCSRLRRRPCALERCWLVGIGRFVRLFCLVYDGGIDLLHGG